LAVPGYGKNQHDQKSAEALSGRMRADRLAVRDERRDGERHAEKRDATDPDGEERRQQSAERPAESSDDDGADEEEQQHDAAALTEGSGLHSTETDESTNDETENRDHVRVS